LGKVKFVHSENPPVAKLILNQLVTVTFPATAPELTPLSFDTAIRSACSAQRLWTNNFRVRQRALADFELLHGSRADGMPYRFLVMGGWGAAHD
jgi:hypothetical protein